MSDDQIIGLPRWLVDALAEYRIDPTFLACAHERLEEDFNGRIPPFDLGELKLSLLDAINAGLLDITEWKDDVCAAFTVADVIELDRIVHNRSAQSIYLGLTGQGGEAWADLRHARWEDYVQFDAISRDGDADEEKRVEINSRNKGKLAIISDNLDYMGYRLIGNVEWSTVSPWEATYWKTLPWAYSVKFRCSEFSTIRPQPEWFANTFRWHDR